MAEMITLYYLPGSCSLATHIVLHDLDVPFEIKEVDRSTKTIKGTGEDFLKINPKGYVPAVRFPDGDVQLENAIILERLADMKLEKHLIPAFGVPLRYKVLEWLHYVSTEIHKAFFPFFAMAEKTAWHDFIHQRLKTQLQHLNQHFSNHLFLMGDQYTVADAYLFTCLSWNKKTKLDFGDIPNVKAFEERMFERESVQKAMKAEGLI